MDDYTVSVTIEGETVEIEADAWRVLMQAVNLLVDTGDITAWHDISAALLAKAKMASGALYLMAHRRSDPA
jgi:hypothetical protein